MRLFLLRNILLAGILFAGTNLCSCSEDDGPDSPGTPPELPSDSESGLVVTFTGKHFRLTDGMNYEGNISHSWKDTVWQNDRAYNQLLLHAVSKDLDQLIVTASPLTGRDNEIPAENIIIYGVLPVAGDAVPSIDAQPSPRPLTYIYDALTEAVPSKIAIGESLPLWLTVDIPEDIPAGNYSGEISIASADSQLATCKIDMLVAPHRLPTSNEWNFYLDLWQFPFRSAAILNDNGSAIQPLSNQHLEILRPFYSILADAGQKTITTYIKDGAFERGNTMIDWIFSADGNWKFDYTKFDRYVSFMDEIGISRQISCFSLAGWNNVIGYTDAADNTYKYKDLPIGSDEFKNIFSAFLTDFRTHLKQQGWFERTVLFMDENSSDEMKVIVEFIRSLGSDWKIGLSGRYMDRSVEQELYNYATIIGTSPVTTAISLPLFYTSCSQLHPNNYLTPINSSAEMSWMAWHAMAKGFKGYQRWAYDYWTRPDVLDARDRTNTAGDFHMIYRSSNTSDMKPLNSIRMQMLRDGIQDYEKARIIGHQKLRNVFRSFTNSEAVDAPAAVMTAQSEIKRLSLK